MPRKLAAFRHDFGGGPEKIPTDRHGDVMQIK
jgi:hypothetical protein